MRLRPSIATLTTLCCASLLICSSAGFAQNLGRGRGGLIEGGPVDVEQLVQRAEVVVHGFIASKQATWIGRVIYTQYEVVVQETVKGTQRNSVLVAVVGGAQGNVRLTVPGAPDLQIGDQLVFFGVPLEGQASFTPVGTFDGIVGIRPGGRGSGATVAPRGRPETLEAFLQELRALGNRP